MHAFVDTNILLKFYHFTKDELDALEKVFTPHAQGHVHVHLTRQVCDEFRRNRESRIKDALKKFKEAKFSPQLPSFMKPYAEYERIRGLCEQLQVAVQSITEQVDRDIQSSSLLADKLIEEVFKKSQVIEVTPEIYVAAKMRVELGNPPGKNGSIGDAVNWTILLACVPDEEPLHIVSEDGDFFSSISEDAAHPFLSEEWARRKKSRLQVYRTLSAFMKANFDGVAFPFDKNKEALIDALVEQKNFAGTHQTIAKLEEYSYFALSEVKRILDAAVANNQFGYIVTDKDVSDFLFRVAVPRQGQLENPEHTALLKEVVDGRAATPNG